ncbi:MAG: hypothetical protein J6R66_00250 [Clostridia bacterium]|nr:hypothetical protein [Clostridia bacterium]
MQKKTKKRLLIALIIFLVVVVLLVIGAFVAINYMFSKVTDSVAETMSGEVVSMPVVDENNTVVPGKTVEIVLDADKIKQLESKISVSDKLAVLGLLAQNLSADDYSTLLSYATGVDNSKVEAAFQLMREKLTPEVKEEIKSYYAKYIHLLE